MNMIRYLIAALLISLPAIAGSITQSGSVTPGHGLSVVTNGVVQDSGAATNGFLTELGITKNGGLAFCINSGPITGPYNELCLGAGTSSAATLSLQNYGGAAAQPLRFIVNGQSYDFPFTTGGNVIGPNSSTVGHIAVFNNSSGTLLKDEQRPTFYITDYGAVCDGSTATDDAALTSAETAAEAVGGGVIVFPAATPTGYCLLSTTHQPTAPVMYVGQGAGSAVAPQVLATTMTRIKWTGGSAPVFKFYSLNYGWGIQNVGIYGQNVATQEIFVDSSIGGYVHNIFGNGCAVDCLKLAATAATNSWNEFDQLRFEDTIGTLHSLIYLTGNYANTAHDEFRQTLLSRRGSTAGIYIGNADNITFIDTYTEANATATGCAVQIDPTENAGFPGENYFVHLEADTWCQPNTTTVTPAIIAGLYQSGVPTLNGTPLVWQADNGVWLYPNSTDIITGTVATVADTNTTIAIYLNRASTQQINLQAVAGRNGAPILIQDLAGNAATYTKTIVSNSPDTINGASSFAITTNYGNAVLTPRPDGSGWLVTSTK